jgi:hypothetical protein
MENMSSVFCVVVRYFHLIILFKKVIPGLNFINFKSKVFNYIPELSCLKVGVHNSCRTISYMSKYSNSKRLQVRGPSRKNSVVKELLNSFQLFALVEHTFHPMMME